MSIGNVGQLAVDLVITSLLPNCCHIGYFYDSCILPVVGNDAFTPPNGSLGQLNVSMEGLLFLFFFSFNKVSPSSVLVTGNWLKAFHMVLTCIIILH